MDIIKPIGSAERVQIHPAVPGIVRTASTVGHDTANAKKPWPSSSLKKRFANFRGYKQISGDDVEDTRGPFGLRLLRYSPEPLIDLIFVHGLRGGSIKTWRKGTEPHSFWPQSWLPLERGFHNVNIHTFGYDSDWASTKSSILNVHDFGQSLLEEMRNSPHLRENGNKPIILVGHSMGGLVIKKAFILSKNVPEFGERIKCIFFIATPHRGSDYAGILNNILKISGVLSSRQYITDLTIGSTSAQLINEEFSRLAHDLPIFSFYETLAMGPGLIVQKHSAILGFKNERVQYINADHRTICKFDSPDDPGYITLKNALTSAIENILKKVFQSKVTRSKKEMQSVKSFLGVTDRPNEHYMRAEGSCQWLDKSEDFQEWRNPPKDPLHEDQSAASIKPHIFWMYANPGTGKTFLASYVVDKLAQSGLEYSYYFFHFENRTSSSLSGFLRSIAYQMALMNAAVCEKLADLYEDGSTLDNDNVPSVWSKVFQRGICEAGITTPQYWVVDALDECNKYQEFFTMLKHLQLTFPLRIFMTSRKVPDMQKLQRSLGASAIVVCREINSEDTNRDIKRFIHDRAGSLPAIKVSESEDLVTTLSHRANTSFLWVQLVLDELETIYANESILQVLENIPEGMVPYYERIIRVMSENKREKHIAKAVTLWVVASARRLTVTELSQALDLDIGAQFINAKGAVEGLCGQLVLVDHQSGLMRLVHPTVREFLLSDAAGYFLVSEAEANQRIALACLKLLSSKEMQPPRSRRQLARRAERLALPLLDYAAIHFSEHVYSAITESEELLLAIHRFLSTNTLSWIEVVAQSGNIYPLIRASKDLNLYLERRKKYDSLLHREVRDIKSWATDLSRVATKFGKALLQSPSSIYYLIPPLCPTKSAISQQVATRLDGIVIVGDRQTVWDDCIAAVNFDEGNTAAAVSCSEKFIAVGMESGEINLYDARSYQKEIVSQQKYPIDLIHFTDRSIVISTIRTLVVLDRQGTVKWQTKIKFRCILLTSSTTTIVAVSQHGHVLKWDILTGNLLEDRGFGYRSPEREMNNAPRVQAPGSASLSPDMELLALGYRWGTVCLWEVQTNDLINSVRDNDTNSAPVLLFNPNPSIGLLLVVYKQRELLLYETGSGWLMKRQSTSGVASIISVTCSPDGRTLASTDTHGTLQIWDFESLNLLYQVATPATSFRTLQFASDGSGVIDMVDSGMRIWTPAILVRRNIEEDQSVSDDAPDLAAVQGDYEMKRTVKITALCAHPSLPVVFVAKHGDIIAFDSRTGTEIEVLYSHAHAALVKHISVSKTNTIASSDVDGIVQVWKLTPAANLKICKGSLLLEIYSTAQIRQLCFSARGDYLLIATAQSDMVYSIKDRSRVGIWDFRLDDRNIWRWLQATNSGTEEEQFALLNGRKLRHFSAPNFPSPSNTTEVEIDYTIDGGIPAVDFNAAFMCAEMQALVIDVHYMSGFIALSTMFLFGFSDIKTPNTAAAAAAAPAAATILTPLSESLTKHCKRFIGFVERSKSLLFLDRDSWLCSVDLASLEKGQYSRHFFVPSEYLTHDTVPVRAADDSFVFCLHGGLAIVRNGLNFRETKEL
ncbi:hypothetical protein F4810DRAFT_712067 [Camillea tinctor]|nr:hypothetical protein F4810DRAFT_712067 [Camillea tinctor]